jgi:hypothetical protein
MPPEATEELLDELDELVLVVDPLKPVVVENVPLDVEPVTPALPPVRFAFGAELGSSVAHAPKHAPKTPIVHAPNKSH